jgi:hypothetical protein
MSTPHEDAVKNKLSLITVAMAQNNFFTPQEIARCIGWICGQTDSGEPIERAVHIYKILNTHGNDESKHQIVSTLTRNVMISFPLPVSAQVENEVQVDAPPSKNVTVERDRSGPSTGAWAAVMCPHCMRGDMGRCPCAQRSRDREEIEKMHKCNEDSQKKSTRQQLEEEWEKRQKDGFMCIAQCCRKCGDGNATKCACAKAKFIKEGLERAERLTRGLGLQ